MPKVVLQEDGSVVLPAETLRRNGWSPGTTFLIEETHGVMVLRPAPDQPAAPADASPAPRDADELVMLRIALGATRSQFALLLDTDLDTVRAWEEGRAFPDGEVARRVAAVAKDPEAARQRLP
ncbi:MAG: hypothetical protein H6739_26630 [Alphaproteobacteria bacterium]|nr:hypothetical protein [Alphaproteobacteria bacterium]